MMKELFENWDAGQWRSASEVKRPFARYPHSEPSPAKYLHIHSPNPQASISVIIPTADADRGGYFKQLIQEIHSQTLEDFELIIVYGDSRQGRAINVGATIARGKYLLTLDDDTMLRDKEAFGKLVKVMDHDSGIGMAGGINVIPPDAAWFVRRAMREIPRRSTPPVAEITDSDFAEHPLLMMRREVFNKVGGENELLPRGLDPYLRQQFRKAGFRVVVVPNVCYSHLPPASLGKLVKQFFRNGSQACYVNRHFPQWVIETPYRHGHFRLHTPSSVRAVRLLCRLMKAFISGKVIWFLCQLSYLAGFLKEQITPDARLKSL